MDQFSIDSAFQEESVCAQLYIWDDSSFLEFSLGSILIE